MAGGGFTISIKTLTGKVFELTDIYANTTTVMIKNKIYDVEIQKLIDDNKLNKIVEWIFTN